MIGGASPRRRMFLAGIAAALVAFVVVALVVRATRGGSPSARAVPQDRPGPVVLVPGYGGGVGGLDVLAQRLRATGREVTVFRLPGDGTGDLTAQADSLDATVTALLRGGAPSVDVVGYSAGGVVARLWVRDHDGAAKARRVVTLGAPHHGTSIASLAAAFLSGACPTACQQLEPDSSLLDSLNSGDETPVGPEWVSIWSTGDDVVTPPDSAALDGATDLTVQSLCPGRQVSHGELPTDAVVTQAVEHAIGVAAYAPFRPTC